MGGEEADRLCTLCGLERWAGWKWHRMALDGIGWHGGVVSVVAVEEKEGCVYGICLSAPVWCL